jgi:8-oxo-dGTP pyrophosphatase MutT (NUDIX family)
VWAPPGGGVEADESDESALVRELGEEAGLHDFAPGPLVWTRTHWTADIAGWSGQTDRIYLVRCEAFEPAPEWSKEQLASEGIAEQRWFTQNELAAGERVYAPRRLPELLRDLLVNGAPAEPIDVGV